MPSCSRTPEDSVHYLHLICKFFVTAGASLDAGASFLDDPSQPRLEPAAFVKGLMFRHEIDVDNRDSFAIADVKVIHFYRSIY